MHLICLIKATLHHDMFEGVPHIDVDELVPFASIFLDEREGAYLLEMVGCERVDPV